MKFTSRPKRAGAALLCLALLAGLLPAGALAADPGISYIDAEGKPQTRDSATAVAEGVTEWTGSDPDGGWYVVNGNIEIGQRVTVTGDVHLNPGGRVQPHRQHRHQGQRYQPPDHLRTVRRHWQTDR